MADVKQVDYSAMLDSALSNSAVGDSSYNVDSVLDSALSGSPVSIEKNVFLKDSDSFAGRVGISVDESQKSFFEGLKVFGDISNWDWLSNKAKEGIAAQEKDIAEYAPQQRSASITKGASDIRKIYDEEGFLPAFSRTGTLLKDMLATGLGSFAISGATAVGSLAAAPLTGGVSIVLPFLVEGTMGAGAIHQTAKELGASDEDADFYSAIGAGPMAVMGRFGASTAMAGIIKGVGLKQTKQELANAYGQQVADTVIQKTYRTLAEAGKGGAVEMMTEGAQKALEISLAGVAADKGAMPIDPSDYASRVIDDAALGFMAGAPVAGTGRVLSDSRRTAALKIAEAQEKILATHRAASAANENAIIDKSLNAPDSLPDNRVLRVARKAMQQTITGLVPLANRVLNGKSVYTAFDSFHDMKSAIAGEYFSDLQNIIREELTPSVKLPFQKVFSKKTDALLGKALEDPDLEVPPNIRRAADRIRSLFGRKISPDITMSQEMLDSALVAGNMDSLMEAVKEARARTLDNSHDTNKQMLENIMRIKEQLNGLKQQYDESLKDKNSAEDQMASLNRIKKTPAYKGLSNAVIRQGKFTGMLGEMRQAGVPVKFLDNYLPAKYNLSTQKQRDAARKLLIENGVNGDTVTRVFDNLAEQEYADTPVASFDDIFFDPKDVTRKSAEAPSRQDFENQRIVPENIRILLRDNGFMDTSATALATEYIMDAAHRVGVQNIRDSITKLLSENKKDVTPEDYYQIKDAYDMVNHRYKLPKTETGKAWKKASNWGQAAGFILTMPLSALTAISEPFIAFATMPSNNALYGLIRSVETGFRKSLRSIFPKRKESNLEKQVGAILQGRDGALAERFADLQETSIPRKVTNAFFRATLMTAVTQMSRYMVFAGAQQQMLQKAKLLFKDVDEAGKPTTVEGVNARGELMKLFAVIDPVNNASLKAFVDSNGQTSDRAINMSLSHYVDTHVMAPNVMNRPKYMNNPALALLWQLKSFMAVFGSTVGYRVYTDITKPMYRNSLENAVKAAVAITLIMAVSMMTQGLRDAIRYGDEESPYDKMESKERLLNALFNTGIFGNATLLKDIATAQEKGGSPWSVIAGPLPSKVMDTFSALVSGNPRRIAAAGTGVVPFLSNLPIANSIRGDLTDSLEEQLIDFGLEPAKRAEGGRISNEPNVGFDLNSVDNFFREKEGLPPINTEALSMPVPDIDTIMYLESKGNPKAHNKSSGAKGAFQITPVAAKELGHDPANLHDLEYNKQVFMDLASKNAEKIQRYLDRPATPFDIYMSHQQGISGYLELLTVPNKPIKNIRKAYIKRNLLSNMLPETKKRANPTIGDWLVDWKDKYDTTRKEYEVGEEE